MNRANDLIQFYKLIDYLKDTLGGPFLLSEKFIKEKTPQRGVYFFMETSEKRMDTGNGLRITRIGTHALTSGAKSTLSQRLSQHRGSLRTGGGNHRGSVFRLLVGTSIFDDSILCDRWGKGSSAEKAIPHNEEWIEIEVSKIIRNMPYIYLKINDEPSPNSLRGLIERNAIALLSNYQKQPLDSPSEEWLGHRCDREKVRLSGLWNQRHVDENYNPEFLQDFEMLIEKMRKTP